MSNKNINQLFEALTPNKEQMDKMFTNISILSQNETRKSNALAPVKRLRPAVLAALLTICLTTTVFAAASIGLDEAFIRFLNPKTSEQTDSLSNGAYTVNKRVENEHGTLTIKQVIGDSNLAYILMDFTAPEGTVLNAARYRFIDVLNKHSYRGSSSSSTGFMVHDDGNPNDNKISLIMSVMTENSIAGQAVHYKFSDLEAADPYPGVFETVIPGSWEVAFTLDFQEYSNIYQLNQQVNLFGYEAALKTISISPISISLNIESEFLSEIYETAGGLKEIGENIHLDNFPITINYKDGSSETTSIFTGWQLAKFDIGHLLAIKVFENIINDKEITSVVFFDKEIPIGN